MVVDELIINSRFDTFISILSFDLHSPCEVEFEYPKQPMELKGIAYQRAGSVTVLALIREEGASEHDSLEIVVTP